MNTRKIRLERNKYIIKDLKYLYKKQKMEIRTIGLKIEYYEIFKFSNILLA